MINHFLATMPLGERVLPEDRSAFYRETVGFYRRYKPDGFTPPDDAYRAQWRLLPRSPYSVFQACALAERLGRASLRKQRKLCAATTRQVERAYAGTQAGSVSIRTSPCTRPPGTAVFSAIPRPSMRRPACWPRTSTRCGWCGRTLWRSCRVASTTSLRTHRATTG